MERVAEIGIYDYINEIFPNLSKDNKVLVRVYVQWKLELIQIKQT